MRTETITSAQNPKFKNLLLLQEKSKARREQGLFVVEGRRELEHCLEAGFRARTVFVCPEVAGERWPVGAGHDDPSVIPGLTGNLVEIPEALYRKAAYARADAVIVCDPLTDLWNPNLIRASIGAVFTVPTVCASSAETIGWLKSRGIRILTAQLQDSSWYYDTDMTGGTALVMGTESTGLTDVWRRAADAHIRIPMLGRLDSLNVSVSAAILLFEAVRQRNS